MTAGAAGAGAGAEVAGEIDRDWVFKHALNGVSKNSEPPQLRPGNVLRSAEPEVAAAPSPLMGVQPRG